MESTLCTSHLSTVQTQGVTYMTSWMPFTTFLMANGRLSKRENGSEEPQQSIMKNLEVRNMIHKRIKLNKFIKEN